jgi:hypothetical protein
MCSAVGWKWCGVNEMEYIGTFSGKLGLHQTADHRLGNKIMAVDAAVNHQRGADDGIIAATFCQTLGQQGISNAPGTSKLCTSQLTCWLSISAENRPAPATRYRCASWL